MKGLTWYQKRRVDEVIAAITKEAQDRGIGGNLFLPGYNIEKSQGMLLVPQGKDYEANKAIADELIIKYRPKLDGTVLRVNPFKKVAAEAGALVILEAKGFLVNAQKGFQYVRGDHGPMYVDGRIVPSYPDFMNLVSAFHQIEYERMTDGADIIIGGETAGINYSAWLAKDLFTGNGVARKKPKEHGKKQQVDALVSPGDVVLLVEDLVRDGGSKLEFVEGVRKVGGTVNDIFVFFDRQEGGAEALAKEGIDLHSVTDLKTTLEIGEKYNYLTKEDLESVAEYLQDPKGWNEKRGYEWKGD